MTTTFSVQISPRDISSIRNPAPGRALLLRHGGSSRRDDFPVAHRRRLESHRSADVARFACRGARLAALALVAGLLGTFGLAAQPGAPSVGSTASRPNVIFILADDLGWTSLSQRMDDRVPGSASDFHETPALERLARAGMRFTQGYAPASICCPTRRSIQFGQTPARQGDERFERVYRAGLEQRITIPRVLKAVDPAYRTAHYGKWDLRSGIFPEELGYDESDGDTGNRHGDVATDKDVKFIAHHLNSDPKRIETLTARALNFMRRQQAAGRPFYLQVSHYATHVDMQARPETYAKYAAKPGGKIHAHAAWAAMLEDLDSGIGRILDAVEELQIADRTYVIFMTDNGGIEFIPPLSNKLGHPSIFPAPGRNRPLRGGKWVLYEGGIRVPFIIAGPGIKAGTQTDVPVTGWDLLPTFADLAGYRGPLPSDLDGGSFRPLLMGGSSPVARPSDALVFHRYTAAYPHSAIRLGDYKLVKIWKSGALELYNLRDDPGELVDLSARRPQKTSELHDALMAYLRSVDAEVLKGFGRVARDD
jgi:arylsulfatase A